MLIFVFIPPFFFGIHLYCSQKQWAAVSTHLLLMILPPHLPGFHSSCRQKKYFRLFQEKVCWAEALTKLHVIGVKLQVIEVNKLKFHIYFKKNSLKRSNSFEQNCDKSVNNSCSALSPCRVSLEMGWLLAGVHCRGSTAKIRQLVVVRRICCCSQSMILLLELLGPAIGCLAGPSSSNSKIMD